MTTVGFVTTDDAHLLIEQLTKLGKAVHRLSASRIEPPDEEEVPHPFNSRTRYEPGDDRDIWCKDCEYHRDHKIHTSVSRIDPPVPSPRLIDLQRICNLNTGQAVVVRDLDSALRAIGAVK